MKPIQVFLRDHAGPLLRAHGFRRSGGTFRNTATNGDVAVISIRSWRLKQAELEFFVEMGLVPRVVLDYWADGAEEVRPERVQFSDTYHTWSTRMRDPARTPLELYDLWQFNLDDDAAIQHFLTTLDSSAKALTALTHRPALIEALRNPSPPGVHTGSNWSLALLLADQGRSPELEEPLEELEASQEDQHLVPWLQARAQTRG